MKSALLNGAISIAVLAAGAALVYYLYSRSQNQQAMAAANASAAQYSQDQDEFLQQQEYSAMLDSTNTADTSAPQSTQATISGSGASTTNAVSATPS
jgi:uncharacterized membrane protein YebE (DUF533 family)